MRRPSSSNTDSARLPGVVRSEGQLLAVVSQRRVASAAAALPANAAEHYAVMSVPVRAVDQHLLAGKARLCAAWERVCDVAALDGNVLADVLTVLLSTAPAAFPDIGPLLRLTAPPSLPRRTAGHPRAFKGTKYRPPKPPRPAALDLRSALCSHRNTYVLLERLWPWRVEALDQLARLRFDEAGLATWSDRSVCSAQPAKHWRRWNSYNKRRGTAAACGASCGRTWPAIPITSFGILRPSHGRVDIRASIWPHGRTGSTTTSRPAVGQSASASSATLSRS